MHVYGIVCMGIDGICRVSGRPQKLNINYSLIHVTVSVMMLSTYLHTHCTKMLHTHVLYR